MIAILYVYLPPPPDLTGICLGMWSHSAQRTAPILVLPGAIQEGTMGSVPMLCPQITPWPVAGVWPHQERTSKK